MLIAVVVVLFAVVLIIVGPPVAKRIAVAGYPLDYDELVDEWAEEYGVDPYLVFAIIRTESGFNPDADSSAGARGLMQMTEETFDWIKGKIAPEEELVFQSLYSPDISIRFGVYFMSLCLERYGGDISTAAAAYHSGWGTVDGLLEDSGNTEDGVALTRFPYTQMGHYVNKINNSYDKYQELYADETEKENNAA